MQFFSKWILFLKLFYFELQKALDIAIAFEISLYTVFNDFLVGS
jgi:hypothetical protein